MSDEKPTDLDIARMLLRENLLRYDEQDRLTAQDQFDIWFANKHANRRETTWALMKRYPKVPRTTLGGIVKRIQAAIDNIREGLDEEPEPAERDPHKMDLARSHDVYETYDTTAALLKPRTNFPDPELMKATGKRPRY